jgi:hypothetical protein
MCPSPENEGKEEHIISKEGAAGKELSKKDQLKEECK